MRRGRFALVVASIVAILAGVYLALALRHPPSLAPAASIRLVSYTNFTMANPDTNALVYPGRGNWLQAEMVLTNERAISISYGAWGGEPYGWANVQTDKGKTNGYLAPRFTGGTALLRPGCAAKFWVVLPTNALQWQCGLTIEAASMRQRAIWRVMESKFYGKLPEPLFYPVRCLSDKTGPSIEVKSITFQVRDSAVFPHNESCQPTPGKRLLAFWSPSARRGCTLR